METCPLPLSPAGTCTWAQQSPLRGTGPRGTWAALRASPTVQPVHRQGAERGVGSRTGAPPAPALAYTAGPETGREKLMGQRTQQAWGDDSATSGVMAHRGTLGTRVTFVLQLPSRERRKR